MSEFWPEFVAWAKDHKAANTLIAYTTAWNKLTRLVSVERMSDITAAHIKVFVKKARAEGLSARGADVYLVHLNNVYANAIKQGWFRGPNPFAPFQRERIREEEAPKFLTSEQVDNLVSVAKEYNERVYLIIALGVFAGLRRDEIMNQRWEEIDFERKTMTVSNKRADSTAGIQDFKTKSGKNRTLPLMSRLAEILEPYRKPDGYIIEPARGETLGRFRHPMPDAFKTVRERAGLPKLHPHQLRHTFASRLVQNGTSLFKVQKWLGHSSARTTQIYARLQEGYDSDIERF